MNAQSITNLAYESINDKYSKAKYGDFDVIMDMSNGYINATKLCADGGKYFKHWMENKSNKELINDFEKNQTEFRPVLFMSDSYGITRGTYVHQDLIPHIAAWVSPSFARKVSIIVNNFLAREREEEIRRLTGDKCRLEKMLDEAKQQRDVDREEYKQRDEYNKKMLQKMIDQNEKTHNKLDDTQKTLEVTHAKLDKADNANEELQNTLEVVVTRLEIVADEIVKPSKRLEVHEQFVIMKLNDNNSNYSFRAFCSQNRGIDQAKNRILREHPNATIFLEITPSPNSKNFLHNLKDLYGDKDNNPKLKFHYNYIALLNDTIEQDLYDMVNTVIEDAKNLASTHFT
jgi:hypothetical protein